MSKTLKDYKEVLHRFHLFVEDEYYPNLLDHRAPRRPIELSPEESVLVLELAEIGLRSLESAQELVEPNP